MVAHRLILSGVPDRKLSPNNRRRMHWASEARLTSQVRDEFGWLLRDHYQGEITASPVQLTVSVIWPRGTRLGDVDALAAMCKPVLDALQGVVYVDDKQVTSVRYSQARDDTGTWPDGCTVIDVEVVAR